MKQYLQASNTVLIMESMLIADRARLESIWVSNSFNLKEGFPALTTKKLAWKSVTSELLWFLEGSDDERRLAEILYEENRDNLKDKKTIWIQNANSKYWKDKAKFNGDVERIYGVQWRDFLGVDQIKI